MTFKKIVEPQNFNNFKMKQSFNSKLEVTLISEVFAR
jgi:hypothetical protein